MKYRWLLSITLVLILLFSSTVPALAASDYKLVKVIVGFNTSLAANDEAPIKSLGALIKQHYHIVPAIAIEIPERMIPYLKALKQVSYVEDDAEVKAIGQTVPYGITKVKADQVHSYNTGSGVKVAVIDTGIDLTHSDLQVYGGANIINSNSTANDDNGHGTHVAGIIAAQDNDIGVVGVAPEAQLYAVKVLDSSGSGTWSSVISGIQWAIDNHMDIINMSLGSSSGSTTLKQACDKAYNAGILVVAAAGNSGTTSTTANNVIYPAAYDSVVAVAAVDSTSTRASFSSTGSQVEVAAPGVDVYSTYKGNAYKTLSGTSMASPHVAGVAALVIASGITDANNNGRINDEVRTRLQQTATDLGTTGRDVIYGYGLVDASKAALPPVNQAPVANAGIDQTVFVNSTVTLDGSGSTDPDKDTLTYSWSQTAGPATVTLSSNTAVKPTFSPLVTGTYKFSLVVNDGKLSSASDEAIITVRESNSAPSAPEVAISPASPLTADDLVCNITKPSTDPNSDTVTYSYAWSKNGTTQNGLITNTVAASYTQKGDKWQCTVTPNDGFVDGPSGTSAEVTIGNTPPVANAGPDQTKQVNSTVTLDGSGSSDADNDTLTYSWSQISGASVTLSSTTIAKPTFTPAVTGTYGFQLVVNDGVINSSADTVSITVNSAQANRMHIQSINMSLVTLYSGYRTSATAKVIVMDAFGNPVSGVTVKGHWSGGAKNSTSGSTNASGQVTLSSSTVSYPRSGTTFTFTIDSLTKSSWTYDSASNVENSDAVQVP
jgi:subtilisin